MDQSDNQIAALPVREKEERPKLMNRVMRLAAFPVSLISGLWVTNISVTGSAHNRAKNYGKFKDVNTKFWGEHAHDVDLKDNKLITQEEFFERVVKNRTEHSAAVEKHMAERGLDKFSAKWAYINRGGKQKAIIEGLTVAGIAVGAMLTIANTKSLAELFLGDPQDTDKER